MKIVVGLGNYGDKYAYTFHNMGFLTVECLADKLGLKFNKKECDALIAVGYRGGEKIILAKPWTYMNLSGVAVAEAANFYKIPPENILVLCDDISFDAGVVRIRRRGSHGGHNGLRNIAAMIGSEEYPRIKLGVGKKPRPDYDLVDWVLGKMPPADREALAARAEDADAAVALILQGKIDEAMNKYSK